MADTNPATPAELAACPCCGGTAHLTKGYATENVWDHGTFHRVFCGVCQLRQLFYRTPEDAIAAWNRRAAAPRNQCDGCAQGAPLRGDLHIDGEGHAFMACQKDRYAAAPLAPAGWQPIETAPKDASRVVIYTPRNGRVQEAWWALEYDGGPGYWQTPPGPMGRGYTILPEAATHWQPLPPPPGAVHTSPSAWRGLTPDERNHWVNELVQFGTDFVAPLFSVIEAVERALQERNSGAPVHPSPGSDPRMAFCPACFVEVSAAEADQQTLDARRYRWLKARNSGPIGIVQYGMEHDEHIPTDQIDAAIDAAMAATPGQQEADQQEKK